MRLVSVFGAVLLLAAVSLPAPAQVPSTPPPLVSETDDMPPALLEVKRAVDRFGRMWEDEDMAAFDDLIAHDADLVVIGTDTAEVLVGFDAFREARQRQFAAFDNVEFEAAEQRIRLAESGDVAWFSETFDLFLISQNQQAVGLEGLRLTGVLERRDGRWQIVQLHTSLPVRGQAAEY